MGAPPRSVLIFFNSGISLPINSKLPGSAWVQIEPAAVEVDRRLEILDVAEAAGHALDLLNLTVEPLAHRVGDRMLVVGQDVLDMPADRLRRLANRRQPTVCRPEVPPLPELPA